MPVVPVAPLVRLGKAVVAVGADAGNETVGIVGIVEVPTLPAVGDTPNVGTAAAELTPRLPISVDPSGIPVRALPPGVVGDVDAGVDDEATLPEPEPHIPEIPEVSSIPEVVDIPDVAGMPDDIDAPDVAAVAGGAVPMAIPPPSKLEVDPYMDVGEVPTVEHGVPLPGIATVPVTPVGAGLTPGEAISVEPSGIPVGETVEPVPRPSGVVAPMLGVGLAIPLTCAEAALQTNTAGRIAATNESLTAILLFEAGIGATSNPPTTGRELDRGSVRG